MLQIGDLILAKPIIQGGMGVGVSLSGLAAAVANEGGLGIISAAGLGILYSNKTESFLEASLTGLRTEIRKAKGATKGAIGVNIMVALTNYPDLVRTSIAENVDVIIAGAGLPLDLPSYLTPGCKTKLIPIVSSGRAAKLICDKWKNNFDYLPDAIVLEGPLAGGHLGYKLEQISDLNFSLEQLLPDVLAVTKEIGEKYNCTIPVIAAGGIYTSEDIANILELGASGVQMGTVFVTTHECDADIKFKQTYIAAKPEDVVLIKSPVGMPGRAINNEFIAKINRGECVPKSCMCHCIKTCKYPETPYCIMLSLFSAYRGRMDRGYAFAGANAHRATEIISVKQLIEQLMVDVKS